MTETLTGLTTERVGPESAADVLAIVQAAFSQRPPMDPPADALSETVESIAAKLSALGGLIARRDGQPVGTLILDPVDQTVFIRRFAVMPGEQGHGIARAMVDRVAAAAGDRFRDLAVIAREELPRNILFWERQGFREIARTSPYVEMRRPLHTHVATVSTPEAMQHLGSRLGAVLAAGDLLVLSGELGAGKTTFTQGLAEGLDVRGPITSPTFVIARIHPPLGSGPELVHVDAYRLGSIAELDDLDLDTDLEDAVTVVEWGAGLAEGLAESRLEIALTRALAADALVDAREGEDPRRVEITPIGPRWHDVDWATITAVID
ncbi:tRNA (adenosine(37)-N6)-threonylcarbamoyltransferase complex ATPase subunit type 1 TsaE [Nocardioides sp. Kera G14]|uniref:tRNA (adenosine(37)-N6)-threonylcarbamoyltransferase complex ATPase subunit type 1 TsaE n=1 Tax=Nocardioides sp. Kera G14 TaxID=2884264 RepID=UPI001D10CACB|nr:tRNA (adenosine(37)-N6)-threonylcarbamoyltransferase complex ATPase subunit type 1 TsaE [Nocardioides sp. Kera G14]UDY24312.1 tRNA (adenosine(37)-N6)-threonylcarbamoyltransferase complex ATPase subunit type 1 TsaE [Nocardioides sp. Kera G14]